jgi:hypothetical protein
VKHFPHEPHWNGFSSDGCSNLVPFSAPEPRANAAGGQLPDAGNDLAGNSSSSSSLPLCTD